ncbi:MAG TPA: DUF892 family protein [Cytophagaceae bacterium]
MKNLEKLYILQLKYIYSAEKQESEALPKMARAANSKVLKTALKDHHGITLRQIGRLEEILSNYNNDDIEEENSNVMEEFIEEFEDMVEDGTEPDILDANIILIAQKIEHFEIASYNSLVTYAKMLGDEKASDLLQATLDEEYEADNKLDKLVEEVINIYVN